MENLTNLSYIRQLCRKYGFKFEKKFGQNFIINPSVCPKIARHAGIDENWGVIEIGTGVGVLTAELAKRAKKVVAVEIDTSLKPLLRETLREFDNVEIVFQDVLQVDLNRLIAEKLSGMPVAVCANLPYYITSPIIMKLLEDCLPVENITVMVQKEAAQRICAAPGSREGGAISLAVQYYSRPEICFTVSPGSFYPAPKVTSSVIRLDILKEGRVQPRDEKFMFRLIRAAFSQRRKTLVNSASAGLGIPKAQIETALADLDIDPKIRPENMALSQFARLADKLIKSGDANE